MRRRALIAAISAAFAVAGSAQQQPATPPMRLGVQTHFSQNWPAAWGDRAIDVTAGSLRDSLPWASGEPRPGRYAIEGSVAGTLSRYCHRSGGDVLLTLDPRHPLYDGGHTVSTPAAMAAYAAYVGTVLDRLPGCVTAIEVGNEINSGNLAYPKGVDPAAAYVALLTVVRDRIKPRHPSVAILGGSTNMIGTGFLETLFKAGMLGVADGVAVHPYRHLADNIDWEIAHLDATMRRYGTPIPIWATEFSDNYPTPDLAAPELVKFVTLMSASGVRRAYWYALIDQRFFRNMGLFTQSQTAKPAAEAFALLTTHMLPAGRAQRIDTGDRDVRLYRFGADRWVVWGPSGTLRFDAGRILSARNRPLPGTNVAIGPDPVVVIGARRFAFTRGTVLADSLSGYGSAPWSYWVEGADGQRHALGILDGMWTSAFGSRFTRPLAISDTGGAVAGDAAHAARALIRYTAPAAMTARVAACIAKSSGGDGLDVALLVRGKRVAGAVVVDRWTATDQTVTLRTGETVDLSVGPNQIPGHDAFTYRIRLTEPGSTISPDATKGPAGCI